MGQVNETGGIDGLTLEVDDTEPGVPISSNRLARTPVSGKYGVA